MTETNYAVATGEWLQEWQEDNNVSTSDLAKHLDMTVEEMESILIGFTPIDEKLAEAISETTSIPAALWMKLEKLYVSDLNRLNLERPVVRNLV